MLYAIAAVIILILDQAMKYWTILNLVPGGEAKAFIPGVAELVHVQNTGAAFGILKNGNARWFFIALTVVFAAVIIYLLAKNIIKGGLGRWSLVMILTGGLGNCIDRVINGYVVDMFNLKFMEFPVFNVADIFITVFGIIFCVYLVFHKEPKQDAADLPSRPLPKATERPKRGVDYLTQLQKPVVEGREAIENEAAAKKRPEPIPLDDSFSAWNMPQPEIDAAPKAEPFIDPFAQPAKRPAAPAPAVDPFAHTEQKPAPAPKKSDAEFTLEDILSEFKD